jgi:exopolyphosphatase/guanosine-5'-triphosphate,3'-diphosphate pyrophosphatase
MRLASIDAGTNTLRLLIVSSKGTGKGRFEPIMRQRCITGLGTGLINTGIFGEKEMKTSLDAFMGFAKAMRNMKVERYFAAGTQAFREAGNARDFIGEVNAETGIQLTVIGAEMEAGLTCDGIKDALGGEMVKNSVLIDIGGGSTEIMRGGTQRGKWLSTKLGVAHLNALFSPHDPPHSWEISNMRFFARDRLHAVRSKIGIKRADKIIGTAGTYTTIAAILRKMNRYDPEIINGTRITRGELGGLAGKLYLLSGKKRLGVRGMERGREYLILPGLILAEEAMDVFSARETIVSDGSILEGIIKAMERGKIKGEVYEK